MTASKLHPICAAVGHPELRLWIYYCPEYGAWRGFSCDGTCDEPGEPVDFDFGPFDDALDVAEFLINKVTAWAHDAYSTRDQDF